MAQLTEKRPALRPEITPAAKCLACGYANKAGEASCAACGSSLDLKLCGACEAINASRAASCHACGVDFAAAERKGTLPAIRLMPRPVLRKSKQLTALLVLPLGATLGLAYYLYGDALRSSVAPVVAPALAQSHQPALVPPPAPAPAPRPVAKVEPPKQIRPAPAKPKETRPPAVPPQQAKSAPALTPPVRPASQSSASVGKAAHPRVTHTRGPATVPLAATAGGINATVRPPASAGKSDDGCSEAVTVLGLCNK